MTLYDYVRKPAPFAPGPSIWTDPHIASEMLKWHLENETDAASYRRPRREGICAYLMKAMGLERGMRLIDLGCGPGLYAAWFAARGLSVSGLDISDNSIGYARRSARENGLSIDYAVGDYRTPFGAERFDAAIMISEDYGVMCPADRAAVLANVYAALKPGGYFAMDVAGAAVWDGLSENGTWYAEEAGFMRPHPHVVIKKTYLFPEEHAFCDMHVVCDDAVTVYYTHLTVYTPERITAELEAAGFEVAYLGGDLEGKPYEPTDKQIGVVARKPA